MQINKINISKSYIEYILVFCFIILLPFENSFLQNTSLGLYGASLSVFPLILLFIYRVLVNKIEKEFFYFLLYSISIFIISLIVFYSLGYSESVILTQPLKNFLLFTTWFYAFFYFKNINFFEYIKYPVKILFYMLIFIILCTIFFTDIVNGLTLINYSEVRNAKLRGFSLEASTFGFLIVTTFLVYILCFRKKIIIYMPFLILFLILLQSKGGMISLLFTFLICSLILFKKNLFKNLTYIFLFLFAYLVVINHLSDWFASDIESYTSFATRLTLIVLGSVSLLFSPLGWGFSGYYPYFYINLEKVISYLQSVSPIPLNFSEVLDYSLVGNFQSVGTKSLVFDCIIVYGFPFLLLMMIYLKNVLRYIINNNDYNRLFALIFIILALLFYNSSFGMYIGAFSLGLVFNQKMKI